MVIKMEKYDYMMSSKNILMNAINSLTPEPYFETYSSVLKSRFASARDTQGTFVSTENHRRCATLAQLFQRYKAVNPFASRLSL